MNLLFVCTENRLRSPTAEAVFSAYPGISALSAGTNADAETPLSGDLIEWADVVLVMETTHRDKVAAKFKALLKDKPLVCLGIPDRYKYMQPELVALLQARVPSACACRRPQSSTAILAVTNSPPRHAPTLTHPVRSVGTAQSYSAAGKRLVAAAFSGRIAVLAIADSTDRAMASRREYPSLR